MYKILFILFLSFIGFCKVSAQTTIVPDTNFRKFLVEKYPSVMDANKAIIDAKAATVIGNMNCSNRNIADLSGIEKFKSITQLFCSNNQLTQLDSLKNLSKLTLLDCHDNPLSHLPSFAAMPNFNYLWCSGCGLTKLPDLSSNVALATFNCYDNKLSEIPGLEKLVNLLYLSCYNNPLKTLPDLSNLKKLILLQCFNNQLSDIPGLSNLVSLQTLVAGSNQLSVLPDLSSLDQLITLKVWGNKLTANPDVSKMTKLGFYDVSYNRLTTLPDFKNNPNLSQLNCEANLLDSLPNLNHLSSLKIIKCSGNKILKLPDLSASKTTLTELSAQSNKLSSLPDFNGFTLLNKLNVQNNQLTFEDLLPILKDTSVKQFTYSPQAKIGIQTAFTATESQAFVLKNNIDASVTTNRYDWFKNEVPVSSQNIDSVLIANVQFADSGTYSCNITNAALPDLTLNRIPFKLLVKKCMDVSSFEVKTTEYECNKGGTITIQPASISGGNPPYRFSLTSPLNKQAITPNGNLFDHLYESNYTMTIKDSKNCAAYKDIQLNGKKPEDCETLVIAYEDNKTNYLSFEEKGMAKVYNKSGKLVNTFSTPANWEGTLENGTVVPGFYIVELNGKHFQVTIIK